MVREIPLTQGKVALVDDEDYDRVAQHKWYAQRDRRNWYAARHIGPFGQRRCLQLHTFILGITDGTWVDHIDADGLNCQKTNLRPTDRCLNAANSRKRVTNMSGYKGVGLLKSSGRYQAQITSNGKNIRLGIFTDPAEAAHAYDDAARRIFGEYARLNFPRDGERQA